MPQDFWMPAALAVLTVFCISLYNSLRLSQLRPGPPGHFFSGNAHQFPTGPGGRQYLNWSKTFGDVVHLRNYSAHVIVLNSERAIRDVFVKQADISSDRPQTTMYCSPDLVDRGKTVFSTNYGERYKRYSKVLHRALGKGAIGAYAEAQDEAANKLIKALLARPDEFKDHIRTFATRIILKVAYGYDVAEQNDYYVRLVQQCIALGNEAFKPGRWLVDSFPLLRFIPAWVPGAGFKRWAAVACAKLREMTRAPIEMVKNQLEDGTAIPSFAARNLLGCRNAEDEETVMWVSAALYVGGADTTVAALSTFILLMIRNPEVQKRAHAELDQTIGPGNLPAATDRARLPYVEAVMKECMRYNTIGPMALAHSLRRNIFYNGHMLPRGATVYENLWAVTRDESIYSEPNLFKPERLLGSLTESERDPWDIVFGYGLRRCPGRYLADATLFIAVARLLSAFSFLPALDSEGNETMPNEEWTSGPNCGPAPFKCRIVPRSQDVIAAIESV